MTQAALRLHSAKCLRRKTFGLLSSKLCGKFPFEVASHLKKYLGTQDLQTECNNACEIIEV